MKKAKELMIKNIIESLRARGFMPSTRTLVYKGLSHSQIEYQVDLRGNNCKVFARGEVSRVWIKKESRLISTLKLDSFEERMDARLQA